jgi:alpha-galactosidase
MVRRDFFGNVLAAPALVLGMAKAGRSLGRPAAAPVANPGGDPGRAQGPGVTEQGNLVTLDNGLIRRSMMLGADGSLKLQSLQSSATRYEWAAQGEPADIYLQMGDAVLTGLQSGHGFRLFGHHQKDLENGATELTIEAVQEATKAKITLFYTIFPSSPVIEHRLIIENQGEKPLAPIARFDPLTLWLKGDQGSLQAYSLSDATETTDLVTPRLARSLTLQPHTLDSTFALTGVNNSAPWLILNDPEKREFLFVGIEWTTDWGLRLLRRDRQVLLTAGALKSVHELEPGQELESPRIFLGLAHGELDDAIHALHDHLRSIFQPTLKDIPWVSYNLWFTEAGDMEEALKKEADIAADLGIECFYHDAGWYDGADTTGAGAFSQGLGNYEELRSRFPHGLGALADYVRSKGMKFGLWVGPPNIDPALVGKKIPPKWLARMKNGQDCIVYGSIWKGVPGFQRICLGCPEVVEYLKKTLSGIIEKWNIEWLKWDPSGSSPFDQVCARTDHGHQEGNGTFAALRGEQEIRQYLMQKFPHLVIENCALGPNAMTRCSRNFPISYEECPRNELHKVRHRVIGASYWFPGAFGASFIWDRPEPIVNRTATSAEELVFTKPVGFLFKPHDTQYLDNVFRSFMMTGFGVGTEDGSISERISRWPPDVIEAARRNIKAFKTYRHLLNGDVYHLAPQSTLYVPDEGDTDQWDILEYAKKDGSEAVAFFFRGGAKDSVRMNALKGLKPDAEYAVTSLNAGALTRASGRTLLQRGVEVSLPEKDTSEILLISES